MPPKAKSKRILKQTTLHSHLSSSPVKSPDKPRKAAQPNRQVVQSVDDSDDSDAASMKLGPRTATQENALKSAPKRKKKARVVSSDEGDSEPGPSRLHKFKKTAKATSSDNSDLSSGPSTKRRKLIRGTRPPSDGDEDDDDDLDQDKVIEVRLRPKGKLSAFQENLERLKRRKQGKNAKLTESEGEDSSPESSEKDSRLFKGSKPTDEYDGLFSGSEKSEDDEDNFIVEDDGTGFAALPTSFSMDAHQDLAHHFKIIFQFFVHIAVLPGPDRRAFVKKQMKDEPYFSVPLTAARKKTIGLRDSLVTSSIWRPEFKKPLETYPLFELSMLEFTVPDCDACHITGRTATRLGRLGGGPYDRLGFQDESDSESEDETSSDDDEHHHSKKNMHLGRFCGQRTRVFHQLTHWEYALFKTILSEVDDLHAAEEAGDSGFLRVGYAGGKKPPEDLEDADGICEWLEDRRVIDMEWKN